VRQLSLTLRSHHALPSRAFAPLYLYAAAAVVLARSNDPLDGPDSAVTLETVDWLGELHVTDMDTTGRCPHNSHGLDRRSRCRKRGPRRHNVGP